MLDNSRLWVTSCYITGSTFKDRSVLAWGLLSVAWLCLSCPASSAPCHRQEIQIAVDRFSRLGALCQLSSVQSPCATTGALRDKADGCLKRSS